MSKRNSPKHLQNIENYVAAKLKLVKKSSSELYDVQQSLCDEILEIFRTAFKSLIDSTITYSNILNEIKIAYENALHIRDQRISQFITQDRLFGISAKKKQRDSRIEALEKENEELKSQQSTFLTEIKDLTNIIAKLKDEQFSEHLCVMRERDARYTLFAENLALQMKVKALDGSESAPQPHADPVLLRLALDRCRQQLANTQRELLRLREEFAETVPQREHDALALQLRDVTASQRALATELDVLRESNNRIADIKKSLEEELAEVRERCSELERAGTPRPHWELCADFIGGGRDRWWQLAQGLSSRDTLLVLLKELGPAAESEHLEYFDGLGTDPAIPPYLRYEGRVRNLRLSRREVSVIINDIWLGKQHHPDTSMQDYVTTYFEDRYGQASVRAEWAYNLCAGAEQMLDEAQVKLWWGVLQGRLSERIYWGLRAHWTALQDAARTHANNRQTITIEELEKVVKSVFPLKSEVDVKNLSDVVRKQLKMKINQTEVNLDKLFQENEEGFGSVELARELYRQRQAAQDKYIREVVAALRPRRGQPRPVTVDELKRAIAIVDPAIDHVRMEQYVRWTFGAGAEPQPLRSVVARLAAGDIERVGPRAATKQRSRYR